MTNGETSDHEVANYFSNLLHPAKICDSEYISPLILIKVENLVCFYRWKFCHHILFRNQITPIHHFLFIMSAFRLISNTKLLLRSDKSMSLQSRILHFTTRRKSWSKQLQSSFIAAPVSKKTS